MIAIVDYGLGNVKAFYNVYRRLGLPVKIATRAEEFEDVEGIILPGVGAFDYAMTRLQGSGMLSTIDELVRGRGIPLLGVCVGMQILAKASEEGVLAGLGYVNGVVRRLPESVDAKDAPLPHMGWNDVKPVDGCRLFDGIETGSQFYFLHSYYLECANGGDVIATSDYNGTFVCAVGTERVFGVQFHPEKSHGGGIRLLENFAKLTRC